jgi:hypothetical protein
MGNKKIGEVIKRYSNLYKGRALSEKSINLIEKKLKIILPNDFKEISKVFDAYEILGGHALYSFNPSVKNYNIVDKTIYYRNSNLYLPTKYIALEETEVNFTVLETHQDANMNTRVICCSIEDIYNLANGKPLLYNPLVFPTFLDFFEYLLDQEEEERRENAEGSPPDIL